MDKRYFLESGLTPLIHEHRHSHFANKTLKFLGDEEESTFLENLRKNPHDTSLNTYLKNPIEYVHNNLGFRSYEDYSKGDKGNIFLGCSHTFGDSLYLEDTWSYKVSKEVGGKFLNLGVPGTAMETGARLLLTYLDYFKTENVFVYYPHVYRYEFFTDGNDKIGRNWITVLPHIHDPEKNWDGVNQRLKRSLLQEDVAISRYISFFYSIIGICNSRNIPVYFINFKKDHKKRDITSRKARDLAHYNVSTHDYLAKDALRKLNLGNPPSIVDTSIEYSHILRDLHNKHKLL